MATRLLCSWNFDSVTEDVEVRKSGNAGCVVRDVNVVWGVRE